MAAMFTIEKNVPAPTTGDNRHKYPFRSMEVGDSFQCNDTASVRAAAYYAGKAHNRKFSVRKIGDGKARVWRVA